MKKILIFLLSMICVISVFSGCGAFEVTNEEFLESLGEGLIAKWETGKKTTWKDTDTYLQEITNVDTCISAEWDVIKGYQKRNFADAEFGELASDYLTYMQNVKGAYEYKENYVNYMSEMYKGLEGATEILTTFAEKYDLYDYIDRKYWDNLEGDTGVCKQIPIDEIMNTDWEGIFEVSIKFGGTYQFHVHDIDKEKKECNVDFRTEDDERITDCRAIILDNSRLYFELEGKDDSQPAKFTINVTKDNGEKSYSLNLINEEYESDDEKIYDLVLDFSVADGDMTVARMSEEEWEQKEEEDDDLIEVEEDDDLIEIEENNVVEDEGVSSDNYDTFIGMEGTYICTSASEEEWTGRVEVFGIDDSGFSFSLGTLEGMPDIMTEYAQIIDSHTAQITTYGVTLTFYWSDEENMSISRSGEFIGGTDAGTLGEITNNQTYIRPLEFNQ